MENEFQKESFVGEKYEKLNNQKFSIPTLIFGACYFAYRKMILNAFILTLIESFISLSLFVVLKNLFSGDVIPEIVTFLAALIIEKIIVDGVAGVLFKIIEKTTSY